MLASVEDKQNKARIMVSELLHATENLNLPNMPNKFKIDGDGYNSLEGFDVMYLNHSQFLPLPRVLESSGTESTGKRALSINHRQRPLPMLENVGGCAEYITPPRKNAGNYGYRNMDEVLRSI